MRVLLFTTVFPNRSQPLHGLFVKERVRHLADAVHVTVVAPVPWFRRCKAIPPLECASGMTVHHPIFLYVPALWKCLDPLFLFLSAVLTCRRVVRREGVDLIDAHFGLPDGVAAVLLGLVLDRPVSVTLRGSEIVLAKWRLRRWALAWAVRRASCVIAVSHDLARFASTLGANESRIHVIPNGVDLERFQPADRSAARRRLQIPESGRLIVSIGHLAAVKGFDRLIQALPDVIALYPDARLAIVGGAGATDQGYGNHLRELINTLGLMDRVLLPGAQPPETIPDWHNAADVFALASDREGSPNVVWEALACGTPVVAARVGEVERMLSPHSGIVWDHASGRQGLAQALSEALARPWDRHAILAQAAPHTWRAVADRVLRAWALTGALMAEPCAGYTASVR